MTPLDDAGAAGKFAKTLLLQFHRSVGADAVAGAMKDSLAKKVAAGALAKFSETLTTVCSASVRLRISRVLISSHSSGPTNISHARVQALGGSAVPQGGKLYFSCKGEAMSIGFGDTPSSETSDHSA